MKVPGASNSTIGLQRRSVTVLPRKLTRLSAALFLVAKVSLVSISAAEALVAAQSSSAGTGPTIRLDSAPGESGGTPVESFMYFVPLISPAPVSSLTSPGSTQSVKVLSAKRHATDRSFLTVCEFEFRGQGTHQSLFDLTGEIQRHQQKLKAGGFMRRCLNSITVDGGGRGRVEVAGTVTNGVQTVTEVRLRFNARSKTSPVWIELCDIGYEAGQFKHLKEMVAQVNTLTFRRQPGSPKMEVTVDSVKKKGAANNLWQSIKGGITGAAVNLLIDPLTITKIGHQAMLDFGQALVSGAPQFTFPQAKNLKNTTAKAKSQDPYHIQWRGRHACIGLKEHR